MEVALAKRFISIVYHIETFSPIVYNIYIYIFGGALNFNLVTIFVSLETM